MADISPGPFAPTVTQWVESGFTLDSKHNKVPAFTSRSIRALAEFPGGGQSGQIHEYDNASGDEVTADLVLLLPPTVTASSTDEWTASDGRRYRANGDPARYRSPFTGTAVTQVNLRRIT